MKRFAILAGSCSLVGCFATPRSMVFGQTAMIPEPGGVQVGASAGFSYQAQAETSGCCAATTSTFSFPTAEANVELGIADRVGLSVHVAPTGLQPSAKLSLAVGEFHLAMLPEAGFGYVGSSVRTVTSSTTPSILSWIVGGKAIVSHPLGFYGGIGYDFQSYSLSNYPGSAPSAYPNSSTETWHNLLAAVGWDFSLGTAVHVRPEITVLYSPKGTTSFTDPRGTTTLNANTTEWVVMPCITVVGGFFAAENH